MSQNLGFKGALVGQVCCYLPCHPLLRLILPNHFHSKAMHQMKQLYKLFLGVDAIQVEVNPFGETPDGRGKTFSLTTASFPLVNHPFTHASNIAFHANII